MTRAVQQVAEELAAGIDRRRFLRRVAHGAFYGMAALAAGGGFGFLRTAVAYAYPVACQPQAGSGCPTGCGPSRCCNSTAGKPSGCNCGSDATCKSGTARCKGLDSTWNNSGCWTCYGSFKNCGAAGCQCRTITTCCDCKTSGCGDSPARCISYKSTLQKVCPNQPVVEIAA